MFLFGKVRKFVELIGWLCLAILAAKGLISFWKEKPSNIAQAQTENPSSEIASVPLYLDYEGFLTDMNGAPLTGYYTVTLRIYADVADPIVNALWSETHPNTPVRDGRFSVLLGNNTALPESLFGLPDRYIGATVAPFDELVPRQRLASVPFAVHADHAASLNAPDGSPTDAVFVDNGGNVGIGTSSPDHKLAVVGNTYLDGNLGIGVSNAQIALDVSGDVNLDGSVTLANWASQSLTDNGYAKVGSLLLQWGKYPNTITEGAFTINFPTVFTEIYNAQCTLINTPWDYQQDTFCQIVSTGISQATFAVNWSAAPTSNGESNGFYWMAIGR